MLKYSDEVRTRLRASGMTDADITKSEVRAEQDLRRVIAAIHRRPGINNEELQRLQEEFCSSVLEPMELRPPGQAA